MPKSLIVKDWEITKNIAVITLTVQDSGRWYNGCLYCYGRYHAIIFIERFNTTCKNGVPTLVETFDFLPRNSEHPAGVRRFLLTPIGTKEALVEASVKHKLNLNYYSSWKISENNMCVLYDHLASQLPDATRPANLEFSPPPSFSPLGNWVNEEDNHNCISWAQRELVFFGHIPEKNVVRNTRWNNIAVFPLEHIGYVGESHHRP